MSKNKKNKTMTRPASSFTTLRDSKIPELIAMLQRFPPCAYPLMCGDRGIDDLRVMAPTDPDNPIGPWEYYSLDAPDTALPWLRK